MKRKAFVQAVLILLLLGISWLALFLRTQKENNPASVNDQGTTDAPPVSAVPESLPEFENASTLETTTVVEVPVNWTEWWDYFEGQRSPQEMRAALEALRTLIQEMDRERAVDWILEFIDSGADMRTGLAFQLQGGGRLRAASSLKAYLLDLLQMLDPELAGSLAGQELERSGTQLVPDVYVVHMRNFARAPILSGEEAYSFLEDKFEDLIHHEPWIENPNSAMAEAMDVAVYTDGVRFVPRLAELMEADRPQMLRHASALTLERLIDRMPLQSLDLLLENIPDQPGIAAARAGYFARLDPSLPGAGELLNDYLNSPALNQEEAVRFLDSFPNLNRSYSYNLLSDGISNTNPGAYVIRFQNALEKIHEWQDEEDLDYLGKELDRTEARIQSQLTGQPLP